MEKEKLDVTAFEIIGHSGNSRMLIHQAFKAMREQDFEQATKFLDESQLEITLAHKAQTDLLHGYANGDEIKIEIIMVHAQDHLMTTMTLREVALEMLYLYQK